MGDTLLPRTSKRWAVGPLGQSHCVLDFGCSTNIARIAKTRLFESGFRGATSSFALLFAVYSFVAANVPPTSPQGMHRVTKHTWRAKQVLHHMLKDCPHVAHSMPLRKVCKFRFLECRLERAPCMAIVTTSALCDSSSQAPIGDMERRIDEGDGPSSMFPVCLLCVIVICCHIAFRLYNKKCFRFAKCTLFVSLLALDFAGCHYLRIFWGTPPPPHTHTHRTLPPNSKVPTAMDWRREGLNLVNPCPPPTI